jgi:peptide/nickel transport system substrate-binding protein
MLSLLAFIPTASSQLPNPTEIISATIWGPETVDPGWCYDTASGQVIMNTYDSMFFFDVDWNLRNTDPASAGSTESFEPRISDYWVVPGSPGYGNATFPQVADGTGITAGQAAPGYTDSTYYFHIRSGITFHDNVTNVEPSDVEYTFERWMALDRSGGPTWMIYEPLLERYHANWSDPTFAQQIDDAVESNASNRWVWFNIKAPNYPTIIIMQVLAQQWASILSQTWAAAHGCWPGTTYTNADMQLYYDPEVSPLDDWPPGTGGKVEMGSGPYELETFDSLAHWYRLQRYGGYFKGWPHPNATSYVKTVTVRGIDEWGTRKAMFLAGDADFCYVPRSHIPELILNWSQNPTFETEDYAAGIDCLPNLPSLSLSAFFFNLNISTTGNSWMGTIQPPGVIDGSGIPPDFFSDKNLRRAFGYCFNWTRYIDEVFMGEAQQPPSPGISGLAYWDHLWDVNGPDLVPGEPDKLIYPYPNVTEPWDQPALDNGTVLPPNPYFYQNLTAAAAEFQLAWGGQVWNQGFTLTILYNTGNEARRVSAQMIEEAAELVDDAAPGTFDITVQEVDWPTYLGELVSHRLTFFIIGWLADYPDMHNFMFPFLHTFGDFSYFSAYSNATIDALLEAGVTETNDDARTMIYWKVCNMFFAENPNIPLVQASGRHWERDWIEGWYYNPIYSGSYFYHYWKQAPGAWEAIDLSAEGTITPTTTAPKMQVYEGAYMVGGVQQSENFTIHIERIDNNTNVGFVHAVIDLRRENQLDSDDFYIADDAVSDIFTLLPIDEHSFNTTWEETSSAEVGNWTLAGMVTAISGDAYDSNMTNNMAPDGDIDARTLTGDINGDGIVDIFDAILLGGAFGSEVGGDRWNALADINGDDVVDIFDAILLAGGFGDSYP